VQFLPEYCVVFWPWYLTFWPQNYNNRSSVKTYNGLIILERLFLELSTFTGWADRQSSNANMGERVYRLTISYGHYSHLVISCSGWFIVLQHPPVRQQHYHLQQYCWTSEWSVSIIRQHRLYAESRLYSFLCTRHHTRWLSCLPLCVSSSVALRRLVTVDRACLPSLLLKHAQTGNAIEKKTLAYADGA